MPSDAECDSAVLGCELEGGGRVGERFCEVCSLQAGVLVDVGGRVVEQGRDQPVDLAGLLTGAVKALVGVANAACDRVEVAAEREERCAEVVRDRTDEEALLSLKTRVVLGRFRKSGGHAGYGGGDVVDLSDWGAGSGADRAAAGYRFDLRAEAAKRSDEPAAGCPNKHGRACEERGEPGSERDEQAT